jgi:radical SAM protein with 4Fe4S-binding SPASM domain
LKKFKKIYIEITNRCNLSCSFCHKSKRPGDVMSPGAFAGIVSRIRDYTGHLSLHVLGEPMLHPELDQLLDICHRQGLRVNLTTNGTLLARKGAMLLASPALRQINISLHSYAERQADSLTNDYMDGIFAFLGEAIAKTGLFINLRLWNMPRPAEVSSSTPNDRILAQLEAFFPAAGKIAALPSTGRGITLAPRVFLSRSHPFTWPHAPGPDYGSQGFCLGLRDHVAILVDGTVAPCCLDAEADINLGNIHHQTLGEILATPRATAIHQGFSQRRVVEPLCRRCSYRQSFACKAKGGAAQPGKQR